MVARLLKAADIILNCLPGNVDEDGKLVDECTFCSSYCGKGEVPDSRCKLLELRLAISDIATEINKYSEKQYKENNVEINLTREKSDKAITNVAQLYNTLKENSKYLRQKFLSSLTDSEIKNIINHSDFSRVDDEKRALYEEVAKESARRLHF